MMRKSNLSRLLDHFGEHQGAISIQSLAQALEVTPARVENMLDFWIRKGRIRVVTENQDCGGCGIKNNCPFILEMPRTYELAQYEEGEIEGQSSR
jgi:hypothetical protein